MSKRFLAKLRGTVASAVFGVVLVSIVGKLLGFIREALVANYYGASYISDIYILQNGIVNAICSVLLCVATTAFIPLYAQRKASGEDHLSFVENTLIFFCVVSAVISFVLFLVPELVLTLIAPGTWAKYSSEQLDTILLSIRLSFFNIILLSVQGVMRALLQSNGKVLLAQSQTLLFNLILIAYLIALNQFDLIGLTLAMVIAQVIIGVVYVVRALQTNMIRATKVTISKCLHDSGMLLKLALPVMLMSILSQASYVVDRGVASGFPEGTMSLIGYASTLAFAVSSLFSESINNVVYPKLARYASKEDEASFCDLGKSIFIASSAILLPLVIGLAVSSSQVIDVIYGRGSFTDANVVQTGKYFMLYMPGIYCMYLRDLINRLCYAKQNTSIPSVCAALGFCSTIGLNLTLPNLVGSGGIVMAATGGAVLSLIVEIILVVAFRVMKFDAEWRKGVVVLVFATVVSTAASIVMHEITITCSPSLRVIASLSVSLVSFLIVTVPLLKSHFAPILKGGLN